MGQQLCAIRSFPDAFLRLFSQTPPLSPNPPLIPRIQGIDLGTASSSVGVWLGGHVEIVTTIPSYVSFREGGAFYLYLCKVLFLLFFFLSLLLLTSPVLRSFPPHTQT